MKKNIKTAKQVFLQWKTYCEKDVGKARFTQTERLEQLDLLCHNFRKYGIDLDEAMDFKKSFVDFVVTPEGMKGNGRHKGWKENAADNFEGILTGYYDGTFETISEEVTAGSLKKNQGGEYGVGDYMDRNSMIVEWSKDKFSDTWDEAICLECHKIASSLNNMFFNEVMLSDWVKTKENTPSWASKLLY